MFKRHRSTFLAFFLSCFVFASFIIIPLFALAPSLTSAASTASLTYSPLAPIPALYGTVPISIGGSNSLGAYLNSWVKILIALATGLAVLYMVWGGVKYSLTDSFSSKGDATKTMQNALWGLLLALTSYLILYTLNPDLLSGTINNLQNESVGNVSEGGAGANTGIAANGGVGAGGAGTASQINSNGLTSWGDPTASSMLGQTINGTQTYYSGNETKTDPNTAAGVDAYGQPLVEGTPTTVGSASSVYYPAGTILKSNGITYVVDDNNLVKQADGSLAPANNRLTNNYTVDLYTTNGARADNTTTNNSMQVLYVPTWTVTGSQLQDIRNNPSKYTGVQ